MLTGIISISIKKKAEMAKIARTWSLAHEDISVNLGCESICVVEHFLARGLIQNSSKRILDMPDVRRFVSFLQNGNYIKPNKCRVHSSLVDPGLSGALNFGDFLRRYGFFRLPEADAGAFFYLDKYNLNFIKRNNIDFGIAPKAVVSIGYEVPFRFEVRGCEFLSVPPFFYPVLVHVVLGHAD
jgi:hypothetical protein